MAGINLGTSSGEDALSPELYPDIVSSTPFLIELFDVKVKDQKAKVDTTLYAYLKEEQRSPWWSAIFSAPFKVLGWTLSLFKDEPEEGDAKLDPFRLTRDESAIADALSKRISVSVDKKTGVTTLSVTMQDPLISASLTDTVMHSCRTTSQIIGLIRLVMIWHLPKNFMEKQRPVMRMPRRNTQIL